MEQTYVGGGGGGEDIGKVKCPGEETKLYLGPQ